VTLSPARPYLKGKIDVSIATTQSGNLTRRHAAFGVFWIVSLVIFWRTISALLEYSLHHESCSHIVLIPLISAYLLFMERKRIFFASSSTGTPGIGLVVIGAILYWLIIRGSIPEQGNVPLSAAALALVLVWIGGFLWSYGIASARAAVFPLLFLLLMVPLPDPILSWVIYLLQRGSTEVAYLLFQMVGVPVLRQGFVLSLPTVAIEVASECSGIRSTIALFITCLLAAHFSLRTPWKILVFLLLVVPLVVIKNGVRIATLTLLSIYVDPGFLHGNLHHDGGFVFFALALLLLLPVFLVLERSERRHVLPKPQQTEIGVAGD
jgi:exosortase